MNLSFKFNNRGRNSILIDRLKEAQVPFTLGPNDTIKFLDKYEEAIEGILSALRNEVFPKWQILSCPLESVQQYRDYMEQHNVPYEEEITDGNVGFLIPRQYRPLSWRFSEPGFVHAYAQSQKIPVTYHSRKAAH